ncbi:MAG: SDR family oxidoreductase [Halobacteriales archaeon]|nr:SDR family oxidoreductase [Halobacteriales archaeon]
MDFANQSVLLVSGTARSARAMARSVAANGGDVAFTYHEDEAKADALLDELEGEGHASWRCDVTDGDRVDEVVNAAFDDRHIDSLVYSVGVFTDTPIDGGDRAEWAWQLEANATGAYHVLGAAAPRLKSQGKGAICALSASAGMLRGPEFAGFDASKVALEALVMEAARELGPHGIRANVVAPGYMRTPAELSDEELEAFYDQTALDRICLDEDVAAVTLFLCSDYARQMTGAVVPVDGGMSITGP